MEFIKSSGRNKPEVILDVELQWAVGSGQSVVISRLIRLI